MKKKTCIFLVDNKVNDELIARIDPDFYVKIKTGSSIEADEKERFAHMATSYFKGQLDSYESARQQIQELKQDDSFGTATGHRGVNELLSTAFSLVLDAPIILQELEVLIQSQTDD